MRIFNVAGVPTARRGFWMVTQADEAELFIYDFIGTDFWGNGVTAAGVAKELKNLSDSVKTVNVRLNSPGGDVFDGVAIYNQLVQHSAKVNMFIDGLAASAASLIAMAGDSIKIAENGMLMIHNPWTGVVGEAKDMRKAADTMDKIKETLVTTYAARTKQNAADVSQWMDDETWLTGQEAVDQGFADEVMPAKSIDSAVTREVIAKLYRKAPAALAKPADKTLPAFDEIQNLRERMALLLQMA